MRFPRLNLKLGWQAQACPLPWLGQKRAITYITHAPSGLPLCGLQHPTVINLSLHRSIIHRRPLNRRFGHSGEKANQNNRDEENERNSPKARSFDFKDPGPLPSSLHNKKYPTTFPLARKILEKYHGYSSFRGEQEKVIARLQERGPTFYMMPTGGGKSLVFQVLARTIPDEGVILIVEPLISLLRVSATPICAFMLCAPHQNYTLFVDKRS